MTERRSTASKKKRMIAALTETGGLVASAARSVGISRDSHYTWLKADPDYAAQVDELTESTLDRIESLVLNMALDDSKDVPIATRLQACMFYLRTKGKGRGFSYQQNVEMKQPAIQVERVILELPDNSGPLTPPNWSEYTKDAY